MVDKNINYFVPIKISIEKEEKVSICQILAELKLLLHEDLEVRYVLFYYNPDNNMNILINNSDLN